MLGDKKILYSGMQATGTLTLGNYLGALKNWVSLNEEYECLYGVMDLHSLTVRQEPAEEPELQAAERRPVKKAAPRKAQNFLLDDDEFEFEFLNMDDKDL